MTDRTTSRRPRGLIQLSETTLDGVDIYGTGVLYELGLAYNCIRLYHWREALNRLKRIPGMCGRRSSWHGYMAEFRDSTIRITRAGTGWTRRRAADDLYRHVIATAVADIHLADGEDRNR